MSTQRYGASLHSGAQVFDFGGFGILGSVISATTATGTNGPGIIIDDLDSGDETVELYVQVETPPAEGTLFLQANGAFEYTGPSTFFTARLFRAGEDMGIETVYLFPEVIGVISSTLGAITGGINVGASSPIGIISSTIGQIIGNITADVSTSAVAIVAGSFDAIIGSIVTTAPNVATITSYLSPIVGSLSAISFTPPTVVNASKFNYAEMLSDTIELINATGREITLQRVEEAKINSTPWKVSGEPVIAETMENIGTFVPAWGNEFGTSWVSQEMLSRVSELCLVAGSPDPKGLLKFTHILDGGVQYAIEWGQVIHPGPLTLLYIFGLTK